MSNENAVPDKITQAIMRVCTPEETEALSDSQMTALIIKMAKRLNEGGIPTLVELNAIKESIGNGAVQMSKEKASPESILAAAQQVFSMEDLQKMVKPQLSLLMDMIAKRMDQDKPAPTLAELKGIKELSEQLWPPAINNIYNAQNTE